MNTSTDSLVVKGPKTPGGVDDGSSATDLHGFFGATPITQPTAASEAAVTVITDSSGGTGALGTGLQALTSTYNSTLTANAISTVALGVNNVSKLANQLRADLVALGLIKGS